MFFKKLFDWLPIYYIVHLHKKFSSCFLEEVSNH